MARLWLCQHRLAMPCPIQNRQVGEQLSCIGLLQCGNFVGHCGGRRRGNLLIAVLPLYSESTVRYQSASLTQAGLP
jgi:hypothetical protein